MAVKIDDLVTFNNTQGNSARGTILKISRDQMVFETYNPYSIVQLSEILSEVRITRSQNTIYNGKAVVSNLIHTGLFLIVSVTLVDEWKEELHFDKFGDVKDEAEKFIGEWQESATQTPESYQLSVGKMRSFLMESSHWLEQVDKEEGVNDEDFIAKFQDPFLQVLANSLMDFEEKAQKIEKESGAICKKFTQRELHPYLMQSPFIHRTFHKPLGYAGDYEMVNMMLRSPYEGQTIYAKLLNLFFLKAGPAEAHRNRIDILLEKLKATVKKSQNARIFCFACGPAIEVQRFLVEEESSDNCSITFLDFSQDTLDYTREILERIKVENGRNTKLEFINRSAHESLKQAVTMREGDVVEEDKYDLFYCAGLFDYLSDKICSKLLKMFYIQTKKDGLLLATNVHVDNPTKRFMEHVMEWYLIYRNDDEFANLIGSYAADKKLYKDKTGYNVFIEVR